LIDAIATEHGAVAFYPFGGPPWLDFQSWALARQFVHARGQDGFRRIELNR
jgi:hypothetical protein